MNTRPALSKESRDGGLRRGWLQEFDAAPSHTECRHTHLLVHHILTRRGCLPQKCFEYRHRLCQGFNRNPDMMYFHVAPRIAGTRPGMDSSITRSTAE